MNKKKIIIIVLIFAIALIVLVFIFYIKFKSIAPQKVNHFYPFAQDRFSQNNEVGEINGSNAVLETGKDSNSDGITDEEAKAKGLNPNITDNDGDGIFDIDEINLTKTDPLKADTDGDGINDLDELNKYGTDPLKADTNGDGVNDGQEIKDKIK